MLKVPSPGRGDEERARLVELAWAGLERRGLGRRVDLDPRLVRLLGLLVRPDREIDARLWIGHPLRAFAAATGDAAVLATLVDDRRVTLTEADATGLPRFALSVLPPLPAGPGRSVTVRTADFEAASSAAKPAEFTAALSARGVRPEDARTLADMVDDLRAHARFGAATRDRWGRRIRVDRVVGSFDTDAGRYLQTSGAGPDGTRWTTISPATGRRLAHLVSDLLPAEVPS